MKQILSENTLLKATKIGMSTLVGVSSKTFPIKNRGNCFSIFTDTGAEYHILNFGLENLDHLMETGAISFPIDIVAVKDRYAVIVDKRIPEDYYWDRFCSSCCPWDLLPIPQQVDNLHKQATGQCTISKISVDGREMIMQSMKVEASAKKLDKNWTFEIVPEINETNIDLTAKVVNIPPQGLIYAPFIPILEKDESSIPDDSKSN